MEAKIFQTSPAQPLPEAPITPDQQCTLQAIVKGKVEALPEDQRKGKGLYPQLWSRFNNHFRIAKYSQLPQCRMSDAIAYLMQMEINQPKALPCADTVPALIPVGRGKNRRKSGTEHLLETLLLETNGLDAGARCYEEWFSRLDAVTGPLYHRAIEAMRRTDDNVMLDSYLSTVSYHRWYVRERLRDARNIAAEACRSAIVVARLLGA